MAIARNTYPTIIWLNPYVAKGKGNVGKSSLSSLIGLMGIDIDNLGEKNTGAGSASSFAEAIASYNKENPAIDSRMDNLVFFDTRIRHPARLTHIPLENGRIIYDSKVRDPITITMRVGIKNYNKRAFQDLLGNLVDMVFGSGVTETWKTTFDKLLYLYKTVNYENTNVGYDANVWKVAPTLCMIQTGSHIYKHMSLINMEQLENPRYFDYLMFNLVWQQVPLGEDDDEDVVPEKPEDTATETIGNILGMTSSLATSVATYAQAAPSFEAGVKKRLNTGIISSLTD